MSEALTRSPSQTQPTRHPLAELRQEVDHLVSGLWGDGGGWLFGGPIPPINLSETANAIEVQIDLPGVKPDEIDIQVRDSYLTVSGERKE